MDVVEGGMKYGTLRFIALVVALAGMAAAFACGHSSSNPGLTPKGISSRQTVPPGEYLITLAPGADAKVISALYGRFGIKSIKDRGRNVFLVIIIEDPGQARMEALRGQSAYVKAVQPN